MAQPRENKRLPPGWGAYQNFTPWKDSVCLIGRSPTPDEITIGESDEDGDHIVTTTHGSIYVSAADEATATELAWAIHRGLLAQAIRP